jgi:putative endonuclease
MNNTEKGKIGEDIASAYLVRRGYTIIDRNFRLKCGELDIVAKKDRLLHFIEVKSVLRNSEGISEDWNPAQNVHRAKIIRMQKAIQIWLYRSGRGHETEFVVDVILVSVYMSKRTGRVEMIENVIF